MNIPAQKRKLKRLVPIFSEELRAVLQHHYLLLPAAGNAKIIARVSNSPMARGFRVLRYHMIRTDVLGICRIAFDQDGRVSALTLIEQLLKPGAEGLRESFKADYSRPSPIPTKRMDGTPLTEEDKQMWRQVEEDQSQERAAEFFELLKQLEEDRDWLGNHQDKFKKLRDKHIAHLEVRASPQGVYEIVSPGGPTWGVIKETLDRLVRIAENLLPLVLQKDENFDQANELFKRDADAFWKLEP